MRLDISLPCEAWVDTLDDALRLAARAREARAFDAVVAATRQRQPATPEDLYHPRSPAQQAISYEFKTLGFQCRFSG
jgi:Uncharacterized protein conserved in bacteria N-term (DUF3322)